MKFLLNMNMPRVLGGLFRAGGHGVRHVGDIGLEKAEDTVILDEARRNQEVVITHDLDYGHVLAFSGATAPSVVIMRLKIVRAESLYRLIMGYWREVERPLSDGAPWSSLKTTLFE